MAEQLTDQALVERASAEAMLLNSKERESAVNFNAIFFIKINLKDKNSPR